MGRPLAFRFVQLRAAHVPARRRQKHSARLRALRRYCKSDIDLRKAQLLGTVKIGDRSATLDRYRADALERSPLKRRPH